jgi:hypothetical protein
VRGNDHRVEDCVRILPGFRECKTVQLLNWAKNRNKIQGWMRRNYEAGQRQRDIKIEEHEREGEDEGKKAEIVRSAAQEGGDESERKVNLKPAASAPLRLRTRARVPLPAVSFGGRMGGVRVPHARPRHSATETAPETGTAPETEPAPETGTAPEI